VKRDEVAFHVFVFDPLYARTVHGRRSVRLSFWTMDHDQLSKELIRAHAFEFIELAAPEAAEYIDRSSIEFLDKEIFTDPPLGERHEADLVLKARFKGRQTCILIHIETQATPQAEFERRMFVYFADLFRKYGLPIYPIVLFTYLRPHRDEPDVFCVSFPDLEVLKFKFRVVQLNKLDWRDFLHKPNPVAAALMARMQIAPKDRPRVKLECFRMMATLKLNPVKARLIGDFVDAYLKLSGKEHREFMEQVQRLEPKAKEKVMQYTNTWFAEGIEKGIAKGKALGIDEGKAMGVREAQVSMILRILRHRFGEIPSRLAGDIGRLRDSQLGKFADAALDFSSIAQARVWLSKRLSK
jgi:predicted transposase YdaD